MRTMLEGRKKMFHLKLHSTHFIYSYMVLKGQCGCMQIEKKPIVEIHFLKDMCWVDAFRKKEKV